MTSLEKNTAAKVKRVPHVSRDFNGKSLFLRFDMPDGLPRMRPFSRIFAIELVSLDLLQIIFPEGTFEIEGRNLIKLFPDLQNEHVRTLAVYDPAKHSDPADSGGNDSDAPDPEPTVITNIVYVPELVEDLPVT